MSRRINLQSELTADEVEYLESRGRERCLGLNAEYLLTRATEVVENTPGGAEVPPVVNPEGSNPVVVQEEEKVPGTGLYDSLKGDDLRAAIAERNAKREGTDEPIIKVEGSKNADLIAALEADDARILATPAE